MCHFSSARSATILIAAISIFAAIVTTSSPTSFTSTFIPAVWTVKHFEMFFAEIRNSRTALSVRSLIWRKNSDQRIMVNGQWILAYHHPWFLEQHIGKNFSIFTLVMSKNNVFLSIFGKVVLRWSCMAPAWFLWPSHPWGRVLKLVMSFLLAITSPRSTYWVVYFKWCAVQIQEYPFKVPTYESSEFDFCHIQLIFYIVQII